MHHLSCRTCPCLRHSSPLLQQSGLLQAAEEVPLRPCELIAHRVATLPQLNVVPLGKPKVLGKDQESHPWWVWHPTRRCIAASSVWHEHKHVVEGSRWALLRFLEADRSHHGEHERHAPMPLFVVIAAAMVELIRGKIARVEQTRVHRLNLEVRVDHFGVKEALQCHSILVDGAVPDNVWIRGRDC